MLSGQHGHLNQIDQVTFLRNNRSPKQHQQAKQDPSIDTCFLPGQVTDSSSIVERQLCDKNMNVS